MRSPLQGPLAAALALFSAAPVASATEWAGNLSCGELQNSPNAKSTAPFTGAVLLSIEGRRAVLERHWASGKERSEGTIVPNEPLRLEGYGQFFSNPDRTWKIRTTLTRSGSRLEGQAVIESRDGSTRYRDCSVSLDASVAAAVAPVQAPEVRKPVAIPGKSPVAGEQRPSGHVSVTLFQDKEGPHGKDERPLSLTISPDSSKLAVGTTLGRIVIIDAHGGARLGESPPLAEPQPASGSRIAWDVQFTPDSQSLAAAVGKQVVIMDPAGTRKAQSAAFDADPRVLAFSPDGTLLAVAIDSRQTRLCVLRVPSLSITWCVGPKTYMVASTARNPKGFEYEESFKGLNWLPDGSSLTAINHGLVQFSRDEGKIINTVGGNGYYRPETPYVLSRDGTQILSMSGANMTRWALATGELLQKSPSIVRARVPLRFGSNGHNIILGDIQQPPTMDLLDVETLKKQASLRATLDLVRKDWVTDFQISQRLDLYAAVIRKPVRTGSDGLEISNHDLQTGVMPSQLR